MVEGGREWRVGVGVGMMLGEWLAYGEVVVKVGLHFWVLCIDGYGVDVGVLMRCWFLMKSSSRMGVVDEAD